MKYVLLLLMIVLSLMGYIFAKKQREWFQPVFIFSVPILISLIVNLIVYDNRYSIKTITYTLYFFSVIVVVLGLQLGTVAKTKIYLSGHQVANKYIYKFLWGFGLISAIFAFQQILNGMAYAFNGKNFIDNIRYYTQYVNEGSFFSEYGIVAADVLMIYLLHDYFVNGNKSKKKSMVFSVILYGLFVATVFNRTNILYLFLVIAFFFMKKKHNFSKKAKKNIFTVVIIGIIVLVFFNFIAIKTNKSVVHATGDVWWTYYLGSEFHWLQDMTIDHDLRTYGAKTLGIFGRALLKFGVLPRENLDYYSTLAKINGNPVPSFVSAPYSDFGWFGLIVLFIYGFLIGIIYRNHLKQGGFWTMIYATCLYQLMISFYSFQFGLSGQFYVIVILAFMLLVRFRRVSYA